MSDRLKTPSQKMQENAADSLKDEAISSSSLEFPHCGRLRKSRRDRATLDYLETLATESQPNAIARVLAQIRK
jgi:hypothetical protein